MVDLNEIAPLLSILISGIIAFVILGLQRLTRTSDDTVEHTVQVKNIEVRVTGFEKKFDSIDSSFREVWRKIDEMSAEIKLHEYRLDKGNNTDAREHERGHQR